MINKIIKTFIVVWELIKEIVPLLNLKATIKKIKDIWNK